MLIACWSVKGGSGTTVVAAGLGIRLARARPAGALLVDLAGDLPAVLGLPEPAGPGVSEWLRSDALAPEVLGRLSVDAGPGLALLPLGHADLPGAPELAGPLLASLAGDRAVVVDAGTRPGLLAARVLAAADTAVLVVRPCYLALRAAVRRSLAASDVVVVDEPGRSFAADDLQAALGLPVRSTLPFDPLVARAVDAGLLAARLPRTLDRGLRWAA